MLYFGHVSCCTKKCGSEVLYDRSQSMEVNVLVFYIVCICIVFVVTFLI